MDITAHNFKDSISEIEKAINEATFLTVDAEFTGLHVSKTIHAFDTPEERYNKLRKGALDFMLIQFGLCTFKCNDASQRYEHKAFNFYVFPKPFKRNGPDVRFMCQSSSIDFLLSQGFDFNKLFRDGISYLSPIDERKLREQLEQKHYQQDNTPSSRFDSPQGDDGLMRSPIPIPDQHKSFIEDVCKRIGEFMKGEDQILDLEPCNAFLRKLIFQTVKQRFPSGVYLESKSTPKKEWFISITKANADKLKEMEEAKKNAELEELDDAVGFAKIIKMISSSGKLVVGHNMLLDILHIIHKFCCPLPADFEDFKAITKCVFPRLLDTKLMATTFPLKDKINKTMLSDLLKILEKDPFGMPDVVVAEGFKGYSTTEEQLHEAGYDAYITGLCFLSMARYIGTLKRKTLNLQPEWSLLEPFINKLYVMLIHDIPYLNLGGDDLTPNRDHVFHVTFPKEWKISDLMQLFSPFGHVFVAWVDDTSAFVALERKDQASLVMRTLTQSDIYHVQSYKEYAQRQKKPNPYDRASGGRARTTKRSPPHESDVNAKRPRHNSLTCE